MNKLVIFALVLALAASAYAACDTTTLTKCASDFTSCSIANALNKDAFCTCYGTYTKCWVTTACASGDSYTTFTKACTDAGCPAATCSSASTVSAVFGLAVAVAAALF